jgi:aspartate racemase
MSGREGFLVLRKLGMIGGMSWISTRAYYERINRLVQQRVAPQASAPIMLESLDFEPIFRVTDAKGWNLASSTLIESARRLEAAGSEALVIASNSMHRLYPNMTAAVGIPILHIADCVGARMAEDGVKVAALLGTRNVMVDNFYRQRLAGYGVELLQPDIGHAEQLDRIIYEELMLGKVSRDAQRELKSMISVKQKEGAQAIVLGSTELEMVVEVHANVMPIYDSARLHAHAAAEWIMDTEAIAMERRSA